MAAGKISIFYSAAAVLLSTVAAQACPVCFAAPESPESRGMTLGILFLLGTVSTILCGIGSFAIYLFSKQKEPAPPYVELAEGTLEPVSANR